MPTTSFRSGLLAGLCLAAIAGPWLVGPAFAQQAASSSGAPAQAALQQVAEFPHQVTGVTVAEDGRIFVNFPRWTEDSPISVAEVGRDGQITPYPDQEWNAWRNAKKDLLTSGDHWVCVQSVVADARGNVWVLDAGAPAQGYVVPGGPKLVRIDLRSNKPAQTIAFDDTVSPQGSYLNDVRFSPDGRHAFITDSGAKGALVVVDLGSGQAHRVLDGHPSTQPEKGLVVKADGRELRRPDGRGVEFAADGIALSPDGRHLYWQAIKGRTLFRITTDDLITGLQAGRDVALKVEEFGQNGVADGLLIDRQGGRMYITSPEDDAVKVRDLSAGPKAKPTVLVQDKRLRWPDTLGQGPDRAIYVTTSRIQDSAFFKADAPPALTTQLWRIDPGAAPGRGAVGRR